MGIEDETVAAAADFARMDDEALLVVLGKQDRAIAANPALAADPRLNPDYDSTRMGVIDDLKALGKRILKLWNAELHRLVCKSEGEDRKKLLDALSVGEGAAIATVTSLLLAIAPAAIAAPAAVVIVRRFLIPAQDELCEAWGEMIEMES